MNRADLDRLADQFILNTIQVHKGDNIWIDCYGPKAKIIADACAKKIRTAGGVPHMSDRGAEYINRTIALMSPEQLDAWGKELLEKMKTMQGSLVIYDDADEAKYNMSPEQKKLYAKARTPALNQRVNHTRWLVVSTPSEELAAACNMTHSEFEKFYLDACLLDYKTMGEAVKPLAKLMADGKNVRIYSPKQGTDLTFSIEGIPSVPCIGERNIPDGECYTAPVKDSVNGTIMFGPSLYDGEKFKFIKLTFKNGRVEHAEAENAERTARLNQILDIDEGARYVGEFSINFNPLIKHPTGDILFDEKIDGGIHMALGLCYDEAPNGNQSVNHWDMVHIQRPDYGGGEIYIDGKLIRKDGVFVTPELQPLNPENLLAATKKAASKNTAAR